MGWWTRGPIVGRGSSATVAVAVSNSSREVLAVKSADVSWSEPLQREQAILSSISSPHIVSYKGWDVTIDGARLVYNVFMEYCPCGTLRDAIDRCGGRLGVREIMQYTRHILIGLDHLHSQGIVHCDIKPRNILIAEDGAKISDFGCAKRVDYPGGPISGTPMFMAPEVARGDGQGQPADVWAVGCTVIEMATGKAPWPESGDPFSVMYGIAYATDLPEMPSCLSDEAKNFLSKCLRRDPNERWTVAQLLKHPFLAQQNSPVSKQTDELNSSSPTCVLDHGFWISSSEESDPESAGPEYTILGSSAADRMKQLSSSSKRQDWTWEEDWATVRGKSDEMEGQTTRTLSGSEAGPIGYSIVPDLSDVSKESVISQELRQLQARNFGSTHSCRHFSRDCKRREGDAVISNDHTGQHRTNLITSNTKLLRFG